MHILFVFRAIFRLPIKLQERQGGGERVCQITGIYPEQGRVGAPAFINVGFLSHRSHLKLDMITLS